jgi:hypothetical protein
MSVTLNQYDGTFAVLGKKSVVALDMETAARVLNASYSEDPLLIQRVKEDIQVETPPTQVQFVTVVEDEAAALAGCTAVPEAFTVQAGTKQIFTATPVTGYHFVDWEILGSSVSSEAVALLTIPESSTVLQIVANFAVDI